VNIDDYRYIITVAELGNFTQAAQKLFIAQPSLSQRVKHIEKSYGISIFNRDTKGVQLTSEGECFVRHARDILENEEDLRRELEEMKNPSRQILRISSSQIIQSYMIEALIHNFHEAYPGVQFDFTENISANDQQEMLLAGKTDVGIMYLPVFSAELDSQVLFEDSFVLVPASESRLEKKVQEYSRMSNEPVPVNLLSGEPFAVAAPGTKLNDYVTSLQQKYSAALDIQHYGKTYSTLYSIAKSGMASTILYESFFDPEQEYIPYYYLDDEKELQIAIVWRKKSFLNQSAREFIDFSRNFAENPSRYADR